MQQTVQSMKGLGVPAGATYAATALELGGGVALILGLLVPIVGLLFVLFMVSASIMKKRKMHADYIAQGKPFYEIDVLYLALASSSCSWAPACSLSTGVWHLGPDLPALGLVEELVFLDS